MKFRELWTEKDNVTLDIKRVLVIPASITSPVALQVMAVLHGQAFAVKDFCEGLAVVVAAIAAMLGAHSLAKGENGQ
jgi:hypothetical protein